MKKQRKRKRRKKNNSKLSKKQLESNDFDMDIIHKYIFTLQTLYLCKFFKMQISKRKSRNDD